MPKLPSCGHTQLSDACKDCLALQAEWYAKLTDFDDIESLARHRPLKQWSSVSVQKFFKCKYKVTSLIDLMASQAFEATVQSVFPDSLVSSKERLLDHPEFDRICQGTVSHGNHRLKPPQIRAIWEAYIEGGTNRSIAKKLHINDSSVFRTITTLIGWMQTMELEDDAVHERGTVITREYKHGQDEAFVYASWRNALWYDDDERREGDGDRFYRKTTKQIRIVLSEPKTVVRIACLQDAPEFIVGYSVMNRGYLVFVYVKADYRNEGIATLLCPKVIGVIHPLTKIGRAIALKKGFIKENENENGKEETSPAADKPTSH